MYRCQNAEGSFACVCPHGLVGDPFKTGCKQPGDCFTDSDCPNSAACIDNRCTNPCDAPGICGRNAECLARDHVPICRCPGQTTGNPAVSIKNLSFKFSKILPFNIDTIFCINIIVIDILNL